MCVSRNIEFQFPRIGPREYCVVVVDIHVPSPVLDDAGIYTDNKCTTISPYIDLTGYIVNLYKSYYYYYGVDRGR